MSQDKTPHDGQALPEKVMKAIYNGHKRRENNDWESETDFAIRIALLAYLLGQRDGVLKGVRAARHDAQMLCAEYGFRNLVEIFRVRPEQELVERALKGDCDAEG